MADTAKTSVNPSGLNDESLRMLREGFGGSLDGVMVANSGEWGGFYIGKGTLRPDAGNYYCPARMKDAILKGKVSSHAGGNAERQFFLVIDDAGTKVPKAELDAPDMPEPYRVIETSKGNFQYVYRLRDDDGPGVPPDAFRPFRWSLRWKADGKAGIQWFRLPSGVNPKPQAKGFQTRIVGKSDSIHTLAELALLIDLSSPSAQRSNAAGTGAPKEDDIMGDMEALKALVALIPNPKDLDRGGWVDTGHAIKRASRNFPDEGLEIFDAWSALWQGIGQSGNGYDQDYTEHWWWDLAADANALGIGRVWLERKAGEADPKGYSAWKAKRARERFDDRLEPDKASIDAAERRDAPRRRAEKWVGEGNPYKGMDIAKLVNAAGTIPPGSATQVEALLKAVLALGPTDLGIEDVVNAIADGTAKVGKRACRAALNRLNGELAFACSPTPDEYQARQEEAVVGAELARKKRIEKLWETVSPLATDPDVMQRVTAYIRSCGVVAEEAGVIGIYIAMTSRLNRRKALSLVRRGVSVSGKNIPIEKVLLIMPPEGVIEISDGSPKSLAFIGGIDGRDAIKHKAVYIPEAAAFAPKHGESDDKAKHLRLLLSENRLTYSMVQRDPETNEMRTETYIKEGPIAVIVTTATNNIEEETMTRILTADADESLAQTDLILNEIFSEASGEAPEPDEAERELLLAFQRWLDEGKPYDVVIPYALAVRAAMSQSAKRLPIRVRRDATSILTAVRTSAIIHKAQREVDEKGRIVATLDDYDVVSKAFSDGLRTLYRPSTAKSTAMLVQAIEAAIADANAKRLENVAEWDRQNPKADPRVRDVQLGFDLSPATSVQISYRQLADRLGLSTIGSLSKRVADAAAEEVIDIQDPQTGRRNAPRSYEVLISSKDLKAHAAGIVMLPSAKQVRRFMADADGTKRIIDQVKAAAIAAKAANRTDENGGEDDDDMGLF